MAVGLAITRQEEFSASDLRRQAGKCSDGAQVRRLLALAMILEGRSRTEAAEANGMDRQTLRDWVHRYNAEGVDGLLDRPWPDRLSERRAAGGIEGVGDRRARFGHAWGGAVALQGSPCRGGEAIWNRGA